MKRFLFLLLSIWQQKLKLYLITAFVGALIGVFILAPSYEYIKSREPDSSPLSSAEYVFKLVSSIFKGTISNENILLIVFYAEIGAILALLLLVMYKFVHKKLVYTDDLKRELDKDLPLIIKQGEGSTLEFKSSMRWDIVESRVNRALEGAVLKTIAGFLNSYNGGTLLIGVSDDGSILGLLNDYQTLKKPNSDGYEQMLMTSISEKLGGDLCSHVHILFHVLEGQHVCRVIVSPASRPVFFKQSNTPKFFVRTGGGTRDLNIQEALEYVAGRWNKLNQP